LTVPDAIDVIEFWFEAHGEKNWWSADPTFDHEIAERFAKTHAALALGEGFTWRHTGEGRLAEIIVLDQFSRQLYRNDPRAFAQDAMALVLAQEAVAGGFDQRPPARQRPFLYMPYVHSESVLIHEAGQPLFAALGEDFRKSCDQHLEVLRRFGRFPKRNAVLGRASTPEEIAYIAESGSRMF
jgi:uncharacterized protein (DUF924 family)